MIDGLTEAQSRFVETYILMPWVFGRDAARTQRAEVGKQFASFNVRHDLIESRIQALNNAEQKSALLGDLALAEPIIKKDPESLDFAAGLAHLDSVNERIQISLKKQQARLKYDLIAAEIAKIAAKRLTDKAAGDDVGLDNQADIDLSWGFVQQRYSSGMNASNMADLDSAIKAMDTLARLIKTAKSMTPFKSRNDAMAGALATAKDGLRKVIQNAQRDLTGTANALTILDGQLVSAFTAPEIPNKVQALLDHVAGCLEAASEPGIDTLVARAETAISAMTAARTAADIAIASHAIWVRSHERFCKTYDIVQQHRHIDEIHHVRPKFEPLKTAYEAAIAKADADNFTAASTALAPLFAQTTAMLDFADDYGRFDDIYDKRLAQVGTLPSAASWPSAVSATISAATTLLTQAETERDAHHLPAAVAKLDLIPAAVRGAETLINHSGRYDAARAETLQKIADFRAEPPEVELLVDNDIDLLDRAVIAAEALAVAGKISQATQKLAGLRGFFTAVTRKIATINTLFTEEQLFDVRLQETERLDGPKGRVAIEVYYQRLLDDRTRINVYMDTRDHALALATATATKAMHPSKIALASVAERYLAQLADLQREIMRLQSGREAGDAAETIALTQSLIVQAAAETRNDKWVLAETLLTHARDELAIGTFIVNSATAISDWLTSANLDNIATDFDAAFAEFTGTRDFVQINDTAGMFRAQFAEATALALAGKALLPGDVKGAQDAITRGIETCKRLGMQVTTQIRYAQNAVFAASELTATEALNVDGCITPELDIMQAKFRSATDKSKNRDFAGALIDLSAVFKHNEIAIEANSFYTHRYKPTHDQIAQTMVNLNAPQLATDMAAERTRLGTIDAAMTAAWTARDFSKAVTKSDQGWQLCDQYFELATSYITAKAHYKLHYTDSGIAALEHPDIPKKLAQIKQIIAGVDALMADRAYQSASQQVLKTAYLVVGVKDAIRAYDIWQPIHDAAQQALDTLVIRDTPEIGAGHDRITELKALFASAKSDANYENFTTGKKKLAGFVQACNAAGVLVDDYVRFTLARDTALLQFDAIAASDTTAIATQFARLDGKRKNALSKAAVFDFAAAVALFDELVSDCATVKATQMAIGSLGDVMDTVKTISDGDQATLITAIDTADTTFKDLCNQPAAMYVKAPIDDIATLIKQAHDTAPVDFDQARSQIGRIALLCRDLRIEMGQLDQLGDAATLAHDLAGKLEKHPHHTTEATAIETARANVDAAMATARTDYTKRTTCVDEIEVVIALLRALRSQLDRHAHYATQQQTTQSALHTKLEKHADRHMAKSDIATAQTALATADGFADARDYDKAIATLRKADDAIETGALRLKLAANIEPTDTEITDLLARKDGHELLDAILNDLDPSTQRKTIARAFKARFGCDLELSKKEWVMQPDGKFLGVVSPDADMDRDAPNLLRFYELMSDLPPSDTLDNDSMILFSHRGGIADGSLYAYDNHEVAIREGEAKTSGIYALSQEAQLGLIAPEYRIDDGEPISYFNWNTLHEVAHAVDDKIGFMRRHDGESGDTYGGWVAHHQNVAPIAAAVAAQYGFDKTYVSEYISRGQGSSPVVPDPVGCDPADWDHRRVACEIWVDRARSTQSPWESRMTAEMCTIDGRIYHESQPGDWVSYLASARTKGVTGYQFRAPAEWFSELYAAFHSRKLKSSHPAYSWLEKL